MARRCEDCIHNKVCDMWAMDSGIPFVNADTCEHYTADVVPKSELEIWKQNRFNIFQRIECYEMTRKKVAREIFEDIEESCVVKWGNTHIFDTDRFDELKNKNTRRKIDMELNREQTIKALEHCTSSTSGEACDGCPFNDMELCDRESNAIEKHALALIKELAVEVVRCKDCEYWTSTCFDPVTAFQYGECRKPLGEYRSCETTSNSFCSCAKKRDGERYE